jgi:dihydrodipicolinate synthase/N-acetylneuraminate lyase
MTTEQFSGVLAAVVTPFTADGSAVDVESVRRQADHIISGGVNGLVPGGSTGEFTALTVEERKASNRAYIEAAAGRVPVVAGTGALSTAETIELTRDAKDAGADAVMVRPALLRRPRLRCPDRSTTRRSPRQSTSRLCTTTSRPPPGWS